jgi:hypothetical protein
MKKNIITGAESADWPNVIGATVNATPAQAQAEGWRNEPEVPPIADGYTRIGIAFIEGDGVTGAWQVVDRLTAEIEAEQAAAEAIRKATPIPYDQPIETPALVLTSHDGGLGIAQAALDDGTVITYTYHASPIPSPEVLRARFEAARDKHLAAKNKALQEINGALQKRIENLERLAGLRE